MRWKYMSRAKSYPPGRKGCSGGDKCALSSTKLPTAGALPLRTATRTRSGAAVRHAWGLETLDADHDAVAPLALLADFDKSGEHRARYWTLQDRGVRSARSAAWRRQARGPLRRAQVQAGNAMARRRARKATTVVAKARAEGRPPSRFAIGGEVDDDAEPEGDRQPRH